MNNTNTKHLSFNTGYLLLAVLMVPALLSLSGCGVSVQGVDLGRVVSAAQNATKMATNEETDEVELGKETAEALFDDHELVDDDELHKYVNKVGYWIASHSTKPDLPWHFAILNDSSVNAFAAPGGYIFITTGMLSTLSNEAEMAGVLAHEIAHVQAEHHLKELEEKASSGLSRDLIAIAAGASDKDRDSGVSVNVSFDKVVADLYNRGLNREDELEADRIGIVLSAKAGYDPYAFASVLQMIESREAEGTGFFKQLIKTHPPASERIENIEPILEQLDNFPLDSRVLASRYRANSFQ